MPKLTDVEKGPLPKAQCAGNIEYGTRLGTLLLEGFSIDEVWDYMMRPLQGLQRALLLAGYKHRLMDLVER